MRRVLVVFCVTVSFCHYTITDSKASEYALGISPAIIEHVATVETTISTSVTLINSTAFPLPIKGSTLPFLATEQVDEPHSPRFDASQWIELAPSDFILQPKEQKTIRVYITAPQGAEPGGHYASIIFEPLIPREALSYDSTVSLARISSLVMLVVPGDIKSQLKVDHWQIPRWQTFGPASYTLSLANSGNVHLVPSVSLSLNNIWGHPVASTTISSLTVLPGTVRDFTLKDSHRLLVGPYKVYAEVTYGNLTTPLQSQSPTIWFVPWPLILIVITLLTVIIKLFIVGRSRLLLVLRILATGKPNQ